MKALEPVALRARAWAERLDALSLRERGLLFGAGVALLYMGWQTLLMRPLSTRTRAAEQRLVHAHQHLTAIQQAGLAALNDPLLAAAARNRALKERLGALDRDLNSAAQGYVKPERMIELLRDILTGQQGLRLVSLANLPVESLSQTTAASTSATAGASAADPDLGPFLHPVEIVVEGDYPTLVAYLRALEGLPWRIHWQQLELSVADYPMNRVRLVIGALSLSRDWISV